MRLAILLALAAPFAASPAAAAADVVAPHDVEDVARIDALLSEVYAVISGPAGEARDWDAMRALFTPEARLEGIGPNGLSGGSLEDYIAQSGPLLVETGFVERELGRRIELYGNLAHAWSSYEGVFTMNGEERRIRGINSFQLLQQPDGSWRVHSILWQPEASAFPLPVDMFEGGN